MSFNIKYKSLFYQHHYINIFVKRSEREREGAWKIERERERSERERERGRGSEGEVEFVFVGKVGSGVVLGDRIEEICPAWCGPQSPPAHITGGFENNFSSQNMAFLPFSDTLVDIRTTVVMVIPETQTGPLEFKDQVRGDISQFLYGIGIF